MPLQLIWKPLVLQYLRRQHRREPELYHGWSWNDIIRWNEDLVIHFLLIHGLIGEYIAHSSCKW